MKKTLLLLLFVALCAHVSWAKKITYTANPAVITGTAWNSLPFTLGFASHPALTNTNGSGNVLYQTKALYGYTRLFLKTNPIPSGMGAFKARVTINFTWMEEGNSTPQSGPNRFLEVSYDPATGAAYTSSDIIRLENACDLTSEIVSITLLSGGTLTPAHLDFIGLESVIEHERIDNYCNVFAPSQGNTTDPVIGISNAYNSTNNELTINWTAQPQAEGYEVEYTFVDDYSDTGVNTPLAPAQIDFSFRNNSTRMLVEDHACTIPLVQERGYLLYRVRGYSFHGPNLDRIFFGETFYNTPSTVAVFPNKFYVTPTVVHTADKINWQSVTTFVEGGKSKTVVKYMDGTMRQRQIVTGANTEHNAIVGETVYDFHGRAAVEMLPAPANSAAIRYYPNFNQNQNGQPYNWTDFDYRDPGVCSSFNIPQLGQQSGAGNYYSAQNPNKTLFNAFIPDAQGYPFSRVTYMPDPTNRIVRQGNVGEVFQPGSTDNQPYQGHDMKYYYGKPDQQKLDYLFGTNVGYAEFYQKNLIVDPNGQVSVSYLDAKGNTIATALAGRQPDGMDALSSNASASFTADLLSGTDIVDSANYSITNAQTFLVSTNNTLYNFHYTLNENTVDILSCEGRNYCLDCIYDLEITLVKDECAAVEYHHASTIGNLANLDFLCHNANGAADVQFSVPLNIGSYTITKKLTVNKDAAEQYIHQVLNDPDNTCLLTFDDFFEEAWNNRDTLRCATACDACMADANSAGSTTQIADAEQECDSLWCNPQIGNLCDMAKMGMINDLTPDGQYAIYRDASGTFNLASSPISIFNSGNTAHFVGNNGSIVNLSIDLPGYPTQPLSYYLSTPTLTQQLILNWPSDLSEKLLPLHPEYCYLEFCGLDFVQDGNDFDTRFMGQTTFGGFKNEFGLSSSISVNNFINYVYDNDPFVTGAPSQVRNELVVKYGDFTGQGHSMPQVALFLANCPSGNINTCTAAWNDGVQDDDEWEKLKNLYYSLKSEYLQKAREYHVLTSGGCCPNYYIGCDVAAGNCYTPVWNALPPLPASCSSVSNPSFSLYGQSIKRFPNINDIDFPGIDEPSGSLYDLTPEEAAEMMQNGVDTAGLCPSCPELDAFKMMFWYIQNQGWIAGNQTVAADAIQGLIDSLQDRILGTLNNDNLSIQLTGPYSFTISHPNCTITFTSNEAIGWDTAVVIPTCMEVIDFKNAVLHVLVNGDYKADIQVVSTCDVFYCMNEYGDGNNGGNNGNDDHCICNTAYSATTTYHSGNIVSYNGQCWQVSQPLPSGGITGITPGASILWTLYCTPGSGGGGTNPGGGGTNPGGGGTNCVCNTLYASSAIYHLDDIVSYNGQCWRVANTPSNGILSNVTPNNASIFWILYCTPGAGGGNNGNGECKDPFSISFGTAYQPFTSSLQQGTPATALNQYALQNTVTAAGITHTLGSDAFVGSPVANNTVLVEKATNVVANHYYMISFDARLISKSTPPPAQTEIKLMVNGTSLGSYTLNYNNYLTFNQLWYSNNITTPTVALVAEGLGTGIIPPLYVIDNFRMICKDTVVIGSKQPKNPIDPKKPGKSSKDKGKITARVGDDLPVDVHAPWIPANLCGCNPLCDPPLPSPDMPEIPCDSILHEIAMQEAGEAYQQYLDSLYHTLLQAYYHQCIQAVESFQSDYFDAEYHYTLYYYDQSNNLVRTVPPAGCKPFSTATDLTTVANNRSQNGASHLPTHILPSTYRHNALNAVVWQKTPDAGETEFFYDALGRIALSQNAKQRPDHTASYITYDYLARQVESGVIEVQGIPLKITAFDYVNWNTFVNSRNRSEINKTWYSESASTPIAAAFGPNGQQNLRHRIGTVAWFANQNKLAALDYEHATHYNYDIAGNMTDLLQDFGADSPFGYDPNNVRTQSKKFNYRFDLISGLVNQLRYQEGEKDQFFYRYHFNADNKLTDAETSANGFIWERDARYAYYRHGPLARLELGTDQVQGLDYAYSLQGFIKGVNGYAATPQSDIGQDAKTVHTGNNDGYQLQNKTYAPDVFSYWISYHDRDYTAVGQTNANIANVTTPFTSSGYHTAAANLYNGNIRSMYTYAQPFGGLGMTYTYDQLNRIKGQKAYDLTTNTTLAGNAWGMTLKYDPNGNIQSLMRRGQVSNFKMDNLQYFYYTASGGIYSGDPIAPDATNKLAYVTDDPGYSNNHTSDIDAQSANNYTYDAIGNLIRDDAEGILSIQWNAKNKITTIDKKPCTQIRYDYDALGNRISKAIDVTCGTTPIKTREYYVRNVQGDIMAVYEVRNGDLYWTEQHLYASSRIGVYNPDKKLTNPGLVKYPKTAITRNTRQYELSNHLGNVLATITDSRSSDNKATLLTATDYYAFGMAMPERQFVAVNSGYRFGFNGVEKDDEVKGAGNSYTFEYRVHDPRLGRFLSVDPLAKDYVFYSPYQFAGNKPIKSIDSRGLEELPKDLPDECVENGSFISHPNGYNYVFTGDGWKKTKSLDVRINTTEISFSEIKSDESSITYDLLSVNTYTKSGMAKVVTNTQIGNITTTGKVSNSGFNLGFEANGFKTNINTKYGDENNNVQVSGALQLATAEGNITQEIFDGQDNKYGLVQGAQLGVAGAKVSTEIGGTIGGMTFSTQLEASAFTLSGGYKFGALIDSKKNTLSIEIDENIGIGIGEHINFKATIPINPHFKDPKSEYPIHPKF